MLSGAALPAPTQCHLLQACKAKSLDAVVVATDDERIAEVSTLQSQR